MLKECVVGEKGIFGMIKMFWFKESGGGLVIDRDEIEVEGFGIFKLVVWFWVC